MRKGFPLFSDLPRGQTSDEFGLAKQNEFAFGGNTMVTIICGGAGFVGLNIAEALSARGREVVLADLAPPPPELLARLDSGFVRFAELDVTDSHAMQSVVTRGIDALVYGAAITAGDSRDREMPERIMTVNLMGFMNAVRAARENGVRRVVNLSSTAAYGNAAFEDAELDEALTRPDPNSLYSISKFATEKVGRRMAELWGMDIRSVRLSGVFGRYEYQTKVRDTPSPLFQVAMAAKNGQPALLPRPGVRDWTYGPDIGGAVSTLLAAGNPGFDLYNIATGAPFAVLDWGRALAKHVPGFECRLVEGGEEPTIDLHAGRDRGPLSVKRLQSDLNYHPLFDLEASAADYWAWLGHKG